MSTFIILIYLSVIIAVLLGIAGIVILIWGLTNKDKKLTIRGTIITSIAAVLIISGAFCGAIKWHKMKGDKCHKQMECMEEFGHGPMCMDMDSMMNCDDSLAGDDTVSVDMNVKCNHMKKMKCVKMKCSPSECKSKCDAEKK